MLSYPFTFPKVRGRFIRRLNRFVVEAEIGGRPEKAYLANPGRLWELLLPGTGLLLTPSPSGGRLPYTVLACQKGGRHVLLHTHLTNSIVRTLIEAGRLPPYAGYRVIGSEPAWGRHRFDLLLQHRRSGRLCYLEIKTCTLFEGRLAAFPDAVTKRGADHLRLLKEIAGPGREAGCLFVIMNPQVKWFIPAYHIDPGFARALLDVRHSVQLNALSFGFDPSFTEVVSVERVLIPYVLIEEQLHGRGFYLLLLYMERPKVVTLPGGENVALEKGCYIYRSPAAADPAGEAARHKQKRKAKQQPIDYLAAAADRIIPIPLVTGENLEQELSADLAAIAGKPIDWPGLDGERGRLFYLAADPLQSPDFIDLIQHYRLARLEQKLPLDGH